MTEDDGIVVVAAHEHFDDDTLLKHLNSRHLPFAGLKSIPSEWKDWMEPLSLWRQYHNQIHELAVPYGEVNGHCHEEVGE